MSQKKLKKPLKKKAAPSEIEPDIDEIAKISIDAVEATDEELDEIELSSENFPEDSQN